MGTLVAHPTPTSSSTSLVADEPHRLPAQPSALIGREQDLVLARALLARPDVRLLTLTGAGGSGKTRLAVAIASTMVADFDGVYFRSARARVERAVERARQVLGREAADAAWAAGDCMSVEQAVAYALSEQDAAPTPTRPAQSNEASMGPLTRREREVAGLVARGLTNLQIADELVVSERTVENHISHILAKLGMQSRTHVATWATVVGLFAAAEK